MNPPKPSAPQNEENAEPANEAEDPAAIEAALEKAVNAVETGMQLYTRGLRSTAIRFYRRAIDDDPHNALAYYMLGLALKDLGEDDDAHAAWNTAATVSDPAPEHAWVTERARALLATYSPSTTQSAA